MGKKKKRCWLSGKLIAPGDAVTRTRRLYGRSSDGSFDIAATPAFAASAWAKARDQFETDTIPLDRLFPDPATRYREWRTPAIAAFHYDLAQDYAKLDIDRAVALVAGHSPRPIRHTWLKGDGKYNLAFEPFCADMGHGEAVNFTWRLLKAGHGADLFRLAAKLEPVKADKVFAMLAAFDRDDCHAAAARHFGLPQLPATMALAFSSRLSLDDHLALVDFGHANTRWRKALLEAMGAYALHLYSNYHPGADWFLHGLEHFAFGHGSQLLYLLVHHPEEDRVLSTMLAERWLPSDVSVGGYDAYSNGRPFYYRAAILNRMLHAPDELDLWLQCDWMKRFLDTAKDRETLRLVERWRKKVKPKPAGP